MAEFAPEGEPMETGIYTLGRHATTYPLILDLTYPISERSAGSFVLEGVEIGSITVSGDDVLVSWYNYNTSTYGVDKIDWDNKLSGAYFETRVLSGNREQLANFTKFILSYIELPVNTDWAMQYSTDYGQNWITTTTLNDIDRKIIYAESEGVESTILQVKAIITAYGNTAPTIKKGSIVLS